MKAVLKGVICVKTRVCVLFGGKSAEYPISLRSCASVLRNIDREKFEIITIGITKNGVWYLYDGDIESIENDTWAEKCAERVCIDHNPADPCILVFGGGDLRKIKADVFFPVLHGTNGEDGRLQGLFDMAGVKYVGVGTLCSAVAMDKEYAKIVFAHAGISQADWVTVHSYDDRTEKIAEAEGRLGYPMFVKPANAGSSFGIGKAHNRDELTAAMDVAFGYDEKILIEELLTGHEVECAVLGNSGSVTASTVGEIVADEEFYTFDSKYSSSSKSRLCIPAEISDSAIEKVRTLAVKAFEALSGRGLSRVDFFADGEDVRINEINTLPGFTSISMYPKLFAHDGIAYGDLLTKIIYLAIGDDYEK